jgi:hypothetical protein
MERDEDKEAAAQHRFERGLRWAERAFDELILPTTMVSWLKPILVFFLCLQRRRR